MWGTPETVRGFLHAKGATPFDELCPDDQRRVPSLMAEIDNRLMGYIPTPVDLDADGPAFGGPEHSAHVERWRSLLAAGG